MKIKNHVATEWRTLFTTIAIGLSSAAAFAQTATTNSLVIHADGGTNTISRMIYGQFSEHLGRCIYEGIWVEPDSSIPNTRGIRNDVVEALKKIKVPVLRCRIDFIGQHPVWDGVFWRQFGRWHGVRRLHQWRGFYEPA